MNIELLKKAHQLFLNKNLILLNRQFGDFPKIRTLFQKYHNLRFVLYKKYHLYF